MDKKELFALVQEEAILLRNNITEEEREKLDYDTLDPNDFCSCIYGQMTGHCNSVRAIDLIKKCCTKIYKPSASTDKINGATLGGSPKGKSRGKDMFDIEYFSPIEVFIYKYKGSHKKLVNFLKKETDKLGF